MQRCKATGVSRFGMFIRVLLQGLRRGKCRLIITFQFLIPVVLVGPPIIYSPDSKPCYILISSNHLDCF